MEEHDMTSMIDLAKRALGRTNDPERARDPKKAEVELRLGRLEQTLARVRMEAKSDASNT
jgi:hypothetical protein